MMTSGLTNHIHAQTKDYKISSQQDSPRQVDKAASGVQSLRALNLPLPLVTGTYASLLHTGPDARLGAGKQVKMF